MDCQAVGPYAIRRHLGQGGMADVYLAWDSRLRREVALKRLRSDRVFADAQHRTLREARAVAKLSHPGIVRVHDVVEDADDRWIVMEYVAGETAAARLARGPVRPAEVVAVGLQLTDALAAAHGAGIIHRDLKPSNVMLTPEGQARILDFGLAFSRSVPTPVATSGPTASLSSGPDPGARVGTLAYMAPEVLRGQPANERSDIYSLGVTLFELATGSRPHGGQAQDSGAGSGTGPTSRQTPRLPHGLSQLIASAVALDPDDRPQSALEMRNAFAALAPEARMRDSLRLAMGTAILAVAALAVWKFAPKPTVSAEPPVVAVLPLAGVGDDPSAEPLAVGIADVLITTLARVPGTTVVSRTATLPYRERQQDLGSIARSLGASWVVDGVVQRSQQRVRVTLSLVRPRTGTVAWSNSYDGSFAEVFELQREVADALAQALRLRLTREERQRAVVPLTTDAEALAAYAEGRALLERQDVPGNIDRATELFRAAISKDPRFALAHAGLGQALWSQFHRTAQPALAEAAEDSIDRAYALDADQPLIGYSLALVQRQRGRNDEAISSLEQVLARTPTSDDAHRLLGQMLVDSGRGEEGLAHLRQAVALRPAYGGNLQALGLGLYDLGRYNEAAGAYGQAAAVQPDNAWAFQMRGAAYHALGRVEEAIKDYQAAVRLGPDAKALSNLGTLFYERSRYAEAVDAYQQAIVIEPGTPATHRNLGDAYRRLGRSGEARAAYEEAVRRSQALLKVNPQDARALGALAVYEAKLGHSRDARRHATRALELAPDSAEARYRRAVVHALCGESESALRWLRAAMDRGYSVNFARADDDLESIRELDPYKALVGERDAVGSR